MYVCMYILYVCMYIGCLYVCISVYKCMYVYLFMHVCMYLCMYVGCMYVCDVCVKHLSRTLQGCLAWQSSRSEKVFLLDGVRTFFRLSVRKWFVSVVVD